MAAVTLRTLQNGGKSLFVTCELFVCGVRYTFGVEGEARVP